MNGSLEAGGGEGGEELCFPPGCRRILYMSVENALVHEISQTIE